MGHVRLGRLAMTHPWRTVVGLLGLGGSSFQDEMPLFVSQLVEAADRKLAGLANEEMLTYSFWLLTRMAVASRTNDFAGELERQGIAISPDMPMISFIGEVADRVSEEAADVGFQSHLGELATLTLRGTLQDTVGLQGQSLFGSSVEDLQVAFRQYSTERQFGELAQRFFSDLMARTLRFVIDRELPRHVGADQPLASVDQHVEFLSALDTYTRQASFIMRRFAEQWYSKAKWETAGDVDRNRVHGFVGYALRKLRTELKYGDRVW